MQKFPRLGVYDEVDAILQGDCKCEATCLLVDDNLFNLIPLEVMLSDIGSIKVLKAQNGLEAVKLYKQDLNKTCCNTKINLVMMDLNMPLMNGFEAAKEIFKLHKQFYDSEEIDEDDHRVYQAKTVDVVAVTAYWDKPTAIKCYLERMRQCFRKPVSHQELKRWLEGDFLRDVGRNNRFNQSNENYARRVWF